MHDDPATTPPPRITDPDDAHVGRDPLVGARSPAIGEDRSPNAWVCPFLRSVADDQALGRPLEAPDPVNRCAALLDPVPQSLRQQELVCLTSGHVNCPRYLRGSQVAAQPLQPVTGARVVSPAIAGSVAVLVVAFLLSVGFVVVNGGLTLTAAVAPAASPSGSVLGEVESAAPTAAATPAPTPESTATPEPTPVPSQTAAPSSSESPSATPVATPTPEATPTVPPAPSPTPTGANPPGATASRMKLLDPCPDKANCYIYLIRSGDNLYSISNYFGVAFKTVKAWNPWTDTGLKVGRELRIPPPTR